MKYVPNIISAVRIAMSILLLFFLRDLSVFIVIYIICGVSDILDGYIARKTNTQSICGARIDSVADICMFTVIIISVFFWLGSELIAFIPIITLIIVIRVISLIIAAYKYHSFIMLHTWGNKLAGLFVFVTPILYIITHGSYIVLTACIISVLSAIEEMAIHITSDKYDLNRRSIFLSN